MELVHGPTLEQILQQDTLFAVSDVVEIGLELCRAVAPVHEAGLVHRDIKAQNVTRTAGGKIVLMDFGTGRELDGADGSDIAGTPLYLAPEIFRGEPASVRSDVYSIGVLLFHLLTGDYPVRGSTVRELRLAHERGEKVDLGSVRFDAPSTLVRVIDRALDAQSSNRHETASALAADLERVRGRSSWRVRGAVIGALMLGAVYVSTTAPWLAPASSPEGAAAAAAPDLRTSAPRPWPTRDARAYDLYVRGRELLDGKTAGGAELALRLFEEALKHDRGFAPAHAALAEIYLPPTLPAVPDLTADEMMRRGKAAAERALALDDSLPEAHLAMAALYVARQQYAFWLSLMGRFDEALQQAAEAESLDPLSPRAKMTTAGVLRFARRYEEAIRKSREALALSPRYPLAFHIIGMSLQGLGRFDEAIEAYQQDQRAPGGNLGYAYAVAGRTADARRVIEDLERRYAETGMDAGAIAQVYVGLGEIDRAFEWLHRGEQAWPAGPASFKVAAIWDPLRADPRFVALLRKRRLAD